MKRRKKAAPSIDDPNEEFFAELEDGALTRRGRDANKACRAASVDVENAIGRNYQNDRQPAWLRLESTDRARQIGVQDVQLNLGSCDGDDAP